MSGTTALAKADGPGRGRPTKLTRELLEKVYKLLLVGLTCEEAARAVGICHETFRAWRRKGEQSKRGLHKEFSAAVKRGRVEAQVNWLAAIEKAIRGEKGQRVIERFDKNGNMIERRTEEYYILQPQWTAAAWKLERHFPERWGRQPLAQVNIQQNTQLSHVQQLAIEAQNMTGEELDRQLAELRKEQDGGDGSADA